MGQRPFLCMDFFINAADFPKKALIIKASMNRPEDLLKECQLRYGISGLVCPESTR